MSSRTPQECVELASDPSAPRDEREAAVDELRTANECDELAALATDDAYETDFRRYVLEKMATPQCEELLAEIADDTGLAETLRREADALLHAPMDE